MELRRSYDRLISTMGFPILVRRHLYIESGPWLPAYLPVLRLYDKHILAPTWDITGNADTYLCFITNAYHPIRLTVSLFQHICRITLLIKSIWVGTLAAPKFTCKRTMGQHYFIVAYAVYSHYSYQVGPYSKTLHDVTRPRWVKGTWTHNW